MAKKNKTKEKENTTPTKIETLTKISKNINKELEKIDNKEFKFLFFVMDTKGAPNGELYYIYSIAKELNDLGYNVSMIHSETEFIGVGEWMGKEYAELPHYNIESDGVKVSPADFLFIPELYSNVMYKTMKLPCKRIAIMFNRRYLTEVIQPGATWQHYGIFDCITPSEKTAKFIKDCFPGLRTNVINPCIDSRFKHDGRAKKLFVNIISNSKSDTNRVVKEFFWQYPSYKWVSFRDIRGLSHEDLSEALKESFLTVCIDDEMSFGYSVLEAMAAENLVICKIPEDEPEWIYTKNEDSDEPQLSDNCVYFEKLNDVNFLIAGAVDAFLTDSIPEIVFDSMKKTVNSYSKKKFEDAVDAVLTDIYVNGRKNELKEALAVANEKISEEEKTEA